MVLLIKKHYLSLCDMTSTPEKTFVLTALQLAATHPSKLPRNTTEKGLTLIPDSIFSNLWIAAISMYGKVGKVPPIYLKGMFLTPKTIADAYTSKIKSTLTSSVTIVKAFHDLIHTIAQEHRLSYNDPEK